MARSARATIDAEVIEVRIVEEIGDEPVASWFVRVWRRLTRYVRRLALRGRNAFYRMVYRLPKGLRTTLYYAAAFVGYFMAWMLFYMSILIAAAFGWVSLIGILVVWGLVFGYVISRLDPNYGIA